ncbi:MAG: hypothetical protein ACHQT9_01360 [Candidatus Saccharimonadales bacterium]
MYFASRVAAGEMLADRILKKHHNTECVVIALDDGGVIVGAQIGVRLKSALMLLLSEEIKLPLEPDALAGISSDGDFAYNTRYSPGEIEEFTGEYRGLIEQEKLTGLHALNRLVKSGSVLNKKLLKGKTIILVSDGLKSNFSIDVALAYLKVVDLKKLIIATPLATVPVIDRMHVAADELYCLDVIDDYISTDHYYEKNDVPDHDVIIKTLQDFIAKWPVPKDKK